MSPSPDGGVRPVVAFSGEPGAFAEDAVRACFVDPDALAVGGFREVLDAVSSDRASFGVLPIENLVNGTVRENEDLLLEHDLQIVAEVIVPVRLCLAALPGERIDGIERVYSHIQALGQADRFLRTRPWSLLTTYNTAGAGKMIAERGERGAAAVLSPRAAAWFGLEVLADSIQNVADNRTRFVVVVRPGFAPEPSWFAVPVVGPGAPHGLHEMRTTLAVAVPDEPGALHRVLGVLAANGVNMSMIESRPLKGRAWEYVFWIDLDAGAEEPGAAASIAELRTFVPMLRVLGTYRRAEP
ncbi:MAG TPA: prephenate dehydratase [Candidatus Limnocylindrales bacterium]